MIGRLAAAPQRECVEGDRISHMRAGESKMTDSVTMDRRTWRPVT